MKNNRMKSALENIAHRGVPENANLWPGIESRLNTRNSFMQTLRARPVIAIIIVMLALLLLTGVVYAIGKSLGYIPGVGIVDQSVPIRVLAKPVVMKRDGVTVTVSKVVTNAKSTLVAYAFDGISMSQNGPPTCFAMPFLQLPNGSKLGFLGGGGGGWEGDANIPVRFETTVYFPPIPASVSHVTFALDCVLPKGTGPENWQIPLDFVAAPDNFVTPAVDVGATFVAAGPKFDVAPTPTLEIKPTPFQYDPSFPNTPTPVPNGSGLYLEQVMDLPDSYILVGNFADAGDLPGPMVSTGSVYDYLPRIEDVNGNPVTFKPRNDIKPIVNWGSAYYWAYEIPKTVKGPLTITLDKININVTSTVRFNFDAGLHPQTGQVWQLNQPIQLGKYNYVVDSAEMIKNGYFFKYHSGIDVPEGSPLSLNIVGNSPETDSSEVNNEKTVVRYSERFTYSTPPPTGQLTMELTLLETIPLQGPWTLTWTPPNTNP